MPSTIVYCFCDNLTRDPVARHVYDACQGITDFAETAITVDGLPVFRRVDEIGNSVFLVRTEEVLTDRYDRYMGVLETHFSGMTIAAVVNWHEGANAPDRIFTVHSNADVTSGSFGLTDPTWMRALMMSVDAARTDLGLLDWSTLVEASHWSGSTSGSHLELVSRFPVPVFDVEIGSTSSSWSDPRAALALARGLLHVPCWIEQPVFSLLCVGGVHFETAFRDALFTSRSPAFAVSHILPSRWVQIDGYQGANGVERFRKCVNTILGGVRAIVFHDSLRADQKSCLRDLGKELDIPVVKHRHLRNGQL